MKKNITFLRLFIIIIASSVIWIGGMSTLIAENPDNYVLYIFFIGMLLFNGLLVKALLDLWKESDRDKTKEQIEILKKKQKDIERNRRFGLYTYIIMLCALILAGVLQGMFF